MNGYDLFMHPLEKGYLSEFRNKFKTQISGSILEIGAGTGVNLDYYTFDNITELTLMDQKIDCHLLNKVERLAPVEKVKIQQNDVENMPFDDNAFDYIVATLVFCSVDSVERGLNEIKRVLKPGGSYFFIEHVLPKEQPKAFICDKITPLWKRLAKNCHLNRDFLSALESTGFTVKDMGKYKLVDVLDPSGKSKITYHYAFVNKDADISLIDKKYTLIKLPVSKVICMTSLQISNFIKLDALQNIVGLTSTRYLFNKQLLDLIEKGKINRIGYEGNFDAETVMALNPEIILISPFKRGGYEPIKNIGIPLVSFLGYKELTPLGQAEWLKFTGLLIGKYDEAVREFNKIEKKYLALQKLTQNLENRPSVMSGQLHSGNWYVVGGKSFLAKLFADAGADYFLKDNEDSGGFYIDFESAYSKGANVDYWRILNNYNGDYSYEVLAQTDARYTDFKSYKDKGVIYCNLSKTPFYESSPVSPELVLADLIKIFHPQLLPDHKPVYYKLLK